ncbi:MAG TPA: GntR family transcriptional regulator [Firmicutes bacterium]|nr:GntR family transcriptional regulator [Bacillota bacterium]
MEKVADRRLEFGGSLSEESAVPLYHQLLGIIKRGIMAGIFKPGDMLPSERDLCERYKVSRSTVRQAIDALVSEGLVYRRQGKGTFIGRSKIQRHLQHLYSFTDDMYRMGLVPSSKILEAVVTEASEDISKNLALPASDKKVTKYTRIRMANDEPLLIETTCVPYYLCPGLIERDLSRQSLYHILRTEYGLEPYRAVETHEAISLAPSEAKLLKCKPGTSGFSIERIAYLETGEPIELTNSITRGDKCKFVVELWANNAQITRKLNPGQP